jgi:putative molybdopterin biosynthesis protein
MGTLVHDKRCSWLVALHHTNAMIKINLHYAWQPAPGQDHALDAMLFRVLSAVARTGSLAATARELGVSYRHVWGLMGKWEKAFGRPLVELQQGRGAGLTEFGRRLLWAEELVQARLAQSLEGVRREIEQVLAVDSGEARLAVCASHDLALSTLRDRLAQGAGLKLDLRVQGSLESLSALAANRCTLAGFHIAEGMDQEAAAAFRAHLSPRRDCLVGVATRTQGLMLARGNPRNIASLADLTRKGVRTVNRQPGSGSRVEFDQLLSGAGIAARDIEGYHDEETTHLAVAARIAGGTADAGFGIRAAAAQYGLDFLPMLTERYYLACRREAIEAPAVKQLLALLRGAQFRELLAGLPGYGSSITGEVYEIDTALPGARRPRSTTTARH